MTGRRRSAAMRRAAIAAAALAATATLAATAAATVTATALRARRAGTEPGWSSGPRSVTDVDASGTRPVWYRAPVSTWWWLSRRSYAAFILREVSSVFVAWSVVVLLLLIRAVAAGPGSYADFLDWAGRPWVMVLDVVAFAFLLYHAVTWFRLTPAAVVIRLRGRRLPASAVVAPAYVAWAVVSVFVTWLLLRP